MLTDLISVGRLLINWGLPDPLWLHFLEVGGTTARLAWVVGHEKMMAVGLNNSISLTVKLTNPKYLWISNENI